MDYGESNGKDKEHEMESASIFRGLYGELQDVELCELNLRTMLMLI